MNLLKGFWEYQKDRFPLAVLPFTSLSVVLSSAAIVIETSIAKSIPLIVLATVTVLLYTFVMRVFDDEKDFEFDKKFHKSRAVQKGVITLRDLRVINYVGIGIQILLNMWLSAFLWWVLAFGYSLLARAEFFVKKWIRKNFFVYNAFNLMQLFLLQIYLYALFTPRIEWSDPLLFVHFLFVLSNAAILEIARKLKTKKDESKGLDTYSAQLGIKKAALFFSGAILVTFVLFAFMITKLAASNLLLLIGIIFLIIPLLATVHYATKQKTKSEKFVEAAAVLFFLSMHVLLMLSSI